MKNEKLIEHHLETFLREAIAGHDKYVTHESFITEEHPDEPYIDYGVTFKNTLSDNKTCCDLRVDENGEIELLQNEDFVSVEVEQFWQYMWMKDWINYEG